MTDSYARLEPYLIMSRSTRGLAAAKIIGDVTAAPGIYHFGPLLRSGNVLALGAQESTAPHLRLLELFAYGTYADYQANPTPYPPLSAQQTIKLKQLTLVSLAMKGRSLSHASLATALALPAPRDLDDLIIDAIYAGLLGGKMSQRDGGMLGVDWVVGRDVRGGAGNGDAGAGGAPSGSGSGSSSGSMDLLDLQVRLENWCNTANTLLSSIDTQIHTARTSAAREASARTAFLAQRDAAFEAQAVAQRDAREAFGAGAGGAAGAAGRKPGADSRGFGAKDKAGGGRRPLRTGGGASTATAAGEGDGHSNFDKDDMGSAEDGGSGGGEGSNRLRK